MHSSYRTSHTTIWYGIATDPVMPARQKTYRKEVWGRFIETNTLVICSCYREQSCLRYWIGVYRTQCISAAFTWELGWVSSPGSKSFSPLFTWVISPRDDFHLGVWSFTVSHPWTSKSIGFTFFFFIPGWIFILVLKRSEDWDEIYPNERSKALWIFVIFLRNIIHTQIQYSNLWKTFVT